MAVMIFANIFLYLDIEELRGEALKHFETVTALNVHIASALTYQVVRGESLRVRIVVFKFLLKRVLRLVKNCILLALAIKLASNYLNFVLISDYRFYHFFKFKL